MRLFVDSADFDAICTIQKFSYIDGITTNPKIIEKSLGGEKNIDDYLLKLSELANQIQKPISIQITSIEIEDIIMEAKKIASINQNFVIKIPANKNGFEAMTMLDSIPINATLCFSISQALLAVKAGAMYVSVFIGRLEDNGYNALRILLDITTMFEKYNFTTKVIAASIRNLRHIELAVKAGADIATIPPIIFMKMPEHILTINGLK